MSALSTRRSGVQVCRVIFQWTRYPNMSVDALPWEVHAQKLDELLRVINEQATQEMADHP